MCVSASDTNWCQSGLSVWSASSGEIAGTSFPIGQPISFLAIILRFRCATWAVWPGQSGSGPRESRLRSIHSPNGPRAFRPLPAWPNALSAPAPGLSVCAAPTNHPVQCSPSCAPRRGGTRTPPVSSPSAPQAPPGNALTFPSRPERPGWATVHDGQLMRSAARAPLARRRGICGGPRWFGDSFCSFNGPC